MTHDVDTSAAGLAYRIVGDGPRIDALVVHGMAEQGSEVLALADALATHHRVLVPDLPGHGGSAGTIDDLPIARLADAVAALCHELNATPTLIVGHSLGGAVATALGADRLTQVRALALLDPGIAYPPEAVAGYHAFYDTLTPDTFAPTLRAALPPILCGPNDEPGLADRVVERMIAFGLDRYLALGRDLVGFDSIGPMSRVACPVLFVSNETPLASMDLVRAQFRSLTVVTLDGVSHQGLVHDPRVVSAIDDFVVRTD